MDNDPKKIEQCKNEDLMYVIAPMYTNSPIVSSPFDVLYSDVEIDGKISSGYIPFGDMHVVCSGMLEKKLGNMPDKYMVKFEKILHTILKVMDDDE